MSLRNNKATRLNRYMMFGTLLLGILVLGCVFAFFYLSFDKTNPLSAGQPEDDATTAQDSIVFIVNDSTLLEE